MITPDFEKAFVEWYQNNVAPENMSEEEAKRRATAIVEGARKESGKISHSDTQDIRRKDVTDMQMLTKQLDEYIAKYYSDTANRRYSLSTKFLFRDKEVSGDLDKFLSTTPAKETFSELVSRLMKERNLTAADVYHDLDMDRRHFSKIHTDKNYQPSKRTAILFAFALKLDLKETKDLLDSAGFSLSHSSKQDLVVEFFIENKMYDLMLLNEMLAEQDLPLLLKCD